MKTIQTEILFLEKGKTQEESIVNVIPVLFSKKTTSLEVPYRAHIDQTVTFHWKTVTFVIWLLLIFFFTLQIPWKPLKTLLLLRNMPIVP